MASLPNLKTATAPGNPGDLLPLGVPQVLVQGNRGCPDSAATSRTVGPRMRAGRAIRFQVQIVPDADHFDVVDPESKAWPVVRAAVLQAFGMKG